MGAKVAKPNPAADNKAKADADLAMKALNKSAENFLAEVRLGTASATTLGYKLIDQKLESQEIQVVVQTQENVVSDDINDAIDSVFSGDWKSVVKFAAKEIISFLGGETPKPAEEAVNKEWAKSYLMWESNALVQYSIYLKKTNAKSIGTTQADTESTLLVCICRGIVDYEWIDPETIVYELSKTQPDMTPKEFQEMIDNVYNELLMAAQMIAVKRRTAAPSASTTTSITV
ncbi:hypothetical protein R1flu_028731 [Riccia fluitans]|uniref:Uncharacterized protein n=1 Tax=Riccia fluitans TaxID=41844 RepID=A0ABD1XN62_9MARC